MGGLPSGECQVYVTIGFDPVFQLFRGLRIESK
jgi:hypothetical protein